MKLILPKEHGSWAILLIPFIAGARIGGELSIPVILFLISVITLFLSYQPLMMILRSKLKISDENIKDAVSSLIIYAPFIFVPASLLILIYGLVELLIFGIAGLVFLAVQLYLARRRLDKTLTGQLFSTSALVMTAPSAYYVSSGRIDETALMIYLLNLLFFGSGIVYVRMKIEAVARKRGFISIREKLYIGRFNIVYHILIIFFIILLFKTGSINLLTLLSFAPITIHSIAGTFFLKERVNFKHLGWLETIYSIIFALALIIEFSNE